MKYSLENRLLKDLKIFRSNRHQEMLSDEWMADSFIPVRKDLHGL